MKFEKARDKNNNESLPEKEKRLAREIGKLPADIIERANLLLVWHGLKPSTKLTYIFKEWGCGDPEPDLRNERKSILIGEFEDMLSKMELASITDKDIRQEPGFDGDIEIPGKEFQTFYIAKELEIAQKLNEQTQQSAEEDISKEHMAKIQELNPSIYAEIIKSKIKK